MTKRDLRKMDSREKLAAMEREDQKFDGKHRHKTPYKRDKKGKKYEHYISDDEDESSEAGFNQ